MTSRWHLDDDDRARWAARPPSSPFINGVLIVNDKSDTPKDWRQGKHTITTMETDASAIVALRHMIQVAGHAYDYFFKNAKGFDPSA